MSRNILRNDLYELAYGHDDIFGWFIQIFDRKQALDDDEGLIRNDDNLTPEQICAIAEHYGFQIEIPEGTIE